MGCFSKKKIEDSSSTASDDTKKGKDSKETKEEEPKPETVGFFELYRDATFIEYIYLIVGLAAAILQGSSLPLLFLWMGDLMDNFIHYERIEQCDRNITLCQEYGVTYTQAEMDDYLDLVSNNMLMIYLMIGFGVLSLVTGICHAGLYSWVASQISERYRKQFFKKVISQEMAFYDTEASPGELSVKVVEDLEKMRLGMGDKVSIAVQFLSQMVTGFVLGFKYSWQLTLVILGVIPILVLVTSIGMAEGAKAATDEKVAYGQAAETANEVLLAIRTITAFGMQKLQTLQYDLDIVDAKKRKTKGGTLMGFTFGMIYLIMYTLYAIAFGFGTWLYDEGKIQPGEISIAFFGVVIAAFSISQAGGNIESVMQAMASAHGIFKLLDRKSKIDPLSEEGVKKNSDEVKGLIELKNVKFSYPSKADIPVLGRDDQGGMNMVIKPGETVAFVGPSGCGKSSTIKLVERFYDVTDGSVTIDGIDVRDFNVRSLRSFMGTVTQEPVLFADTIKMNVAAGCGVDVDKVTEEQVISALKEANAWDFIQRFPQGINTHVGDKGGHLSGGQKQRIAIARALISNPKILLLDEATSALDAEAEKIVQDALDRVSQNRTTIIIAHRLSTVKNADRIFGIREGQVVEVGSHNELIQKEGGLYRALVDAQTSVEDAEKRKVAEQELKDEKDRVKPENVKAKGSKEEAHSMIALAEENENYGEDEKDLPTPSFSEIMFFAMPELWMIVFACLCSAVAGAADAGFAVVFADLIRGEVDQCRHRKHSWSSWMNIPVDPNPFPLRIYTYTRSEMWKELWKYVGLFCGVGVIAFFAWFFKMLFGSISTGRMVRRVRYRYFECLLRQEMGFFDDPKYPVGILAARLMNDCSKFEGLGATKFVQLSAAAGSLLAAMIIGFLFSWQLTLLCLAFVPFMALAGLIEMQQMIKKQDQDESKEQENKNMYIKDREAITAEATNMITTVASLGKEPILIDEFNQAGKNDLKADLKSASLRGFAHGYAQCIIFFAYGGVFRLGLELVENGTLEFNNVFKTLLAVIFGGMAVGQALGLMPDASAAILGARRVFYMYQRVSAIDPSNESGKQPEKVTGKIEFKNVEFTYPSRPDMKILKGLNFTVSPGETVALVGQSGCGKSTCIQLLERFYDPDGGQVLLDGVDTKDLNLKWLRQTFGFVQQEPVLR